MTKTTLEKWIWILIYGGLLIAGLGLSVQQRNEGLVSCQGSNAACSLALKPDGLNASLRHSPSYDSSSRLASGLDGGAIKRHLSPDTTLGLPVTLSGALLAGLGVVCIFVRARMK